MTGMFSQLHLLNKALHGSAQNHNVLSQNIANVNTPGYKTQQIEFEDFLRQVESEPGSDEAVEVTVETVDGLTERFDGNNVDLEREISALKENALAAQAYTQLLASKMSTLRRAISS